MINNLKFSKYLFFAIVVFIFSIFIGCNKSNILKKNERDDKIKITIDGEHLKTGRGISFDFQKDVTWQNIQAVPELLGVEFENDWFLDKWKLTSKDGIVLNDNYKFEKDAVVFACAINIPKDMFEINDLGNIKLKDGFDKTKVPEVLHIPERIDEKEIRCIGENAFKDCSNIKTLDLSRCSNFVFIGESSFENCVNLKNIIFPSSLESINNNAFKNCTSLKKIDLSGCKNLVSISGFSGCIGLTNIDLSNFLKLEAVTDFAFYGCIKLVVSLPSSVINVGESAFGKLDGGNDYRCKNVKIPNKKVGNILYDKIIGFPCNYPEERILQL